MYRYFYRYSRSADRRRGWARGLAVHKESPVPPGFFLFPPSGGWTWHNFYSPNGGDNSPEGNSLYGSPPGRSFYSCKRNQNTLGALPQDPCRWLCWIRICFSFNDQEKQIRTAHRIAPKVAAAHLPFPPTPFPDGGKGARMGKRLETEGDALGVLGLAKAASHRP